jgi:HK97 gp10 family phage protein
LASFTLEIDSMKLRTKEMEPKIQRALLGLCQHWDGPIEAHMKHNAPWRDRTTNARNGLAARGVKVSKTVFAIILSHAVSYGIYLERGTRYMRARPIINPTIDLYSPRVMASTIDLLDRLDRA